MALVTRTSNKSVLEVTKERLDRIFSNGVKVYLSTSGGKDSVSLSNLVYQYLKDNPVPKDEFVVQFVDEEAMFKDVIDIVKEWRKKFIELGYKFEWYCMEFKHFNCLNTLMDDETFITWDRKKKDVWVRDKPDFAIEHHPLHMARYWSYQEFLQKRNRDGVTLTGIRMGESYQRRKAIARTFSNNTFPKVYTQFISPIYDWSDDDIWLYLKENKLKFPETYLNLYQIGTAKNRLRISQFFSIDTARVLVQMNRFKPRLMDKVIEREPNAYLTTLYWNSVLFKTIRDKKGKKEKKSIDYKKKVFEYLKNPNNYDVHAKRKLNKTIKIMLVKYATRFNNNDYKKLYNILVAGDPKSREIRGLIGSALTRTGKKMGEKD